MLDTIRAFYTNKKISIWSIILAVYIAPTSLFYFQNYDIEGSWKRAINMALHHGLVYGLQFVYTYGPLGFLSTRNTEYIPSIFILIFDLLLVTGAYYFFHKCVSRNSKWVWVILPAVLFARGAEYTQLYFLVFILIIALAAQSRFSSLFEMAYIGMAGAIVFFVKVNYGLIAFVILAVLAVALVFISLRSLAALLGGIALVCVAVYIPSRIDIVGYLSGSLFYIKVSDQSILKPMAIADPIVLMAFAQIALFAALYVPGTIRTLRSGFNPYKLVPFLLFPFVLFLFFKNGFTRADVIHYGVFFAIGPLFIASFAFFANSRKSIPAIIVSLCLTSVAFLFIQFRDHSFSLMHNLTYVVPGYSAQYVKRAQPEAGNVTMDQGALTQIGRASIDIFPIEIATVQVNGLNYAPRPIPQSYCVVGGKFDSLNTAYFVSQARPSFVMIKNAGIDGRYPFWDESLTKATLQLNYEFKNEVTTGTEHVEHFLLLASRPSRPQYPVFEPLQEMHTKFGDSVFFRYPATDIIYFTADIQYNTLAKLEKLLFQPPTATITLFFADSSSAVYPAMLPMLQTPCLINKAIISNTDLEHFFTGKPRLCRDIIGLTFNSYRNSFKPDVHLRFMRFSNYKQ